MAHDYGSNYERLPIVAPIWQKLEGIEQHLDRVDLALNTILKHLNITLPGLAPNSVTDIPSLPEAPDKAVISISDTQYEYKALDGEKAEIRVLALNNADDDSEDLVGSLVHHRLEAKPGTGMIRYNALSYTWGEPKMDRRIVIDGHSFFVTKNLESALRQMRKTASKNASTVRQAPAQSFWWVDQICMILPHRLVLVLRARA